MKKQHSIMILRATKKGVKSWAPGIFDRSGYPQEGTPHTKSQYRKGL